MSLVRPEVARALSRWREVLTGLGVVGAGVWLGGLGGWFFGGLGVLVGVAGLGLAAAGVRRVRFRGDGQAPGLVRMVEGQVAYFGPETGGFAALSEVEALQLVSSEVGPAWVLVQPGARLEIPVAAEGAERLYDFFGALPGIDMAAVTAAVTASVREASEDGAGQAPRILWRRDLPAQLPGRDRAGGAGPS
ncbi:MAG: hypothetical protein ACXIU8_03340 [Alkalilacustris sp.]